MFDCRGWGRVDEEDQVLGRLLTYNGIRVIMDKTKARYRKLRIGQTENSEGWSCTVCKKTKKGVEAN